MKSSFFAKVYGLVCLFASLWLITQFVQNQPIQTELTALLPQDIYANPIIQAAEKSQETILNQQIIVLIGANNPDQAFQAANKVAQQWRNSHLFSRVDAKIEPDLTLLRQSIHTLGVATLPKSSIQQLLQHPEDYFTELAQSIINPFSAGLLPLEQDWLGLSRFTFAQHNNQRFNWHAEYAMLYTEFDGKTWVLLRAHLPNTQTHLALLSLLQQTKQQAQTENYTVLASSGALFAAYAKAAAEQESSWMSTIGLSLTFGLLWWVFRSKRIVSLLLPLSMGILLGLSTTIALFGTVHALTLVVGTSLIGVLVDFPLHWLASSLFQSKRSNWQAKANMQRVLPSFLISLIITVIGYLFLWFTPLPILRQTAVFSAVALLGSFLATIWFLPIFFQNYQARPSFLVPLISNLLRHFTVKKILPLAGIVTVFLLAGLPKLQWHDDIRNWITLNPSLLSDSQYIAQINAMEATQLVLITAPSTDELLKNNQQLEQILQTQHLGHVQALSQWVQPTDVQNQLKQQFKKLANQPNAYQTLSEIGIPSNVIQTALHDAAQTAPVSLEESLHFPQAEPFRTLYLGKINGQYASVARLFKMHDIDALNRQLKPNWQLLDKRHHLNQQFKTTRDHAAWLKITSFILAWLVLWRLFNFKLASLILIVPCVATLGTLGLLGWLDINVSLFVLFGLMLASAIGIDYAVYAFTAPESIITRIAGITLAALTTIISFILLTWSTTPAVAAFGISVSFGVLLNWLATVMLTIHIKTNLSLKGKS